MSLHLKDPRDRGDQGTGSLKSDYSANRTMYIVIKQNNVIEAGWKQA
jgi:hypothetical protein